MIGNSQLSRTLHLLLHLAEHPAPLTSAQLACSLRTNAVVVRRMMAGLRNAGLVRSEKGRGGGWTLACSLEDVSLYDVYMALGAPLPFALRNRTDNPSCSIERVVNEALHNALCHAERLLLARLSNITLAGLATQLCQGGVDDSRIYGK